MKPAGLCRGLIERRIISAYSSYSSIFSKKSVLHHQSVPKPGPNKADEARVLINTIRSTILTTGLRTSRVSGELGWADYIN